MSKIVVLASLLCFYSSITIANTQSDIQKLRLLPSTIQCLYSGLNYQNENILYGLYFYRIGQTETYHAEEITIADLEFKNDVEQVLEQWTAQLTQNQTGVYTLNPIGTQSNALRIDIAKKKVRFAYDPPTSGHETLEFVGKILKHNFDFRCEGGPLNN